MWARNLLFIAVVLGGAVFLRSSLYPPALSRPIHRAVSAAGPARPRPLDDHAEVAARIDEALRQEWQKLGIRPAPPAADLTVARRMALALVGTVPSLEEVRAIEGIEPADRLRWYRDHLLDDRRSADYLAERLARTYVGTEDGPFLRFRRRRFATWLSDQLLANRPYGDIVHDLIADTGLWTDHPATNFITVTFSETSKRPDPEKLAGRVARAFLGLRLDCAQCHDRPGEWKQVQFRGLAAFFGQTEQGFSGTYDDPHAEYTFENRKEPTRPITVAPAVPFHAELCPTHGSRRQQLADWVTHPDNELFARAMVQRVWALLTGRPYGERVESVTPDEAPPTVIRLLAEDFAAHRHDLHRLVRIITDLRAYRLDSAAEWPLTDAHDQAWAAFPLTRLRPEQMAGSLLQATSLKTVDRQSMLLVRVVHFGEEREFIHRYGDLGVDELEEHAGTIPQRLLLMNGELMKKTTRDELLNAATQIADLAPDDVRAVEAAYLAVLCRRPGPAEARHFEQRLRGRHGQERKHVLEDVYWALLNGTEFSWDH